LLCLAIAGAAATASSCKGGAAATDGKANKPAGVAVTVATAGLREMPVQFATFGTVEPYRKVEIKSQVAGQLAEVLIERGQRVKAGDKLFRIDPQLFNASCEAAAARLKAADARLGVARANLVRDEATLRNGQSDFDRAMALGLKGYATPREFDQARNALASLAAATQAEEAEVLVEKAAISVEDAAVKTAKIQLSYTEITAPIDGVVGDLLIDPGNLVKVNDLPMAIIHKIEPIFVIFSIPQQDREMLDRARRSGPVRVKVKVQETTVGNVAGAASAGSAGSQPDRATRPAAGASGEIVGQVTFIDNKVDPATGMIGVKAEFANSGSGGNPPLWPGDFVSVALLLSEGTSVAVPSQAIVPGQRGPQIFVVTPGREVKPGEPVAGTVEMRPIAPGRTVGDYTVVDAVKDGERVVTDGQLNLTPGAKVFEKPAVGAAAAATKADAEKADRR
jgi:multidrug efflux system membrane fusion protein